MNLTPNWRDRRTVFTPPHYSIVNYSTDTKNDMKTAFGDDLFLNNLHLIPDPLLKNLADTIITEEKMAPKSKLENNIDVKTNENMHIQPDYNPLSGITSFFSGVMSVISNAMFSKRKHFAANTDGQMAVPPMWHPAKITDENKILPDENCSNDMSSDLLPSEMTDCKRTVAHCQNKLEQVRLLLGSSKPVPCNFRTQRRPKKVFVEASSVKEEQFEDAFSPEDFENIANDSYIEYSSPVCYHDHVFHEVDAPKVKVETAKTTETAPKQPIVCESTEIVKNVPEIDTMPENKLDCDTKQELVASCEDKLNRLKALLQERKKKAKTIVETEPEPVPVPESQEPPKLKTATKVKDKRFKNPNRCTGKRMKSKMKKNIQDDLQFANEICSEDLSSVENSPSMCYLEKHISNLKMPDKEYFDEVSGRFHPSSVPESEDSFQIVFNDSPKLRRTSDCDSEDSFIIFEDSPDSCYTSNDVFGESTDSEDYDSDSDLSDSGCGNMSFLAASLSKSVCNLADDSLYEDPCEDEVDCAKVLDVKVCDDNVPCDLETGDLKTGLLIDERKKLLRKDLPAKKVHFSEQPPKVHVMRVWSFAARQARAGHWERYTLDRERFKRRIADVDVAVSWVLKPQHRSRVMFQRFMPWWNAQKRKELAEKKERDAQEKLRREEEELKAEAEKLKPEEEIAEVGVDTEKMVNGEVNFTTEENEGDDKRGEDAEKQETNLEKNIVKEIDCLKNDSNRQMNKLSVTENIKNCTENEIKNNGKKSYNNKMISVNEKMLDLNADFVAKSALDT